MRKKTDPIEHGDKGPGIRFDRYTRKEFIARLRPGQKLNICPYMEQTTKDKREIKVGTIEAVYPHHCIVKYQAVVKKCWIPVRVMRKESFMNTELMLWNLGGGQESENET